MSGLLTVSVDLVTVDAVIEVTDVIVAVADVYETVPVELVLLDDVNVSVTKCQYL